MIDTIEAIKNSHWDLTSLSTKEIATEWVSEHNRLKSDLWNEIKKGETN